MFFSVITKNLVTFKRWDGVKDEKLTLWGFVEKSHFQRGVHKKLIYRGELPEKGRGWTVCRLRGELSEIGGGGGVERG